MTTSLWNSVLVGVTLCKEKIVTQRDTEITQRNTENLKEYISTKFIIPSIPDEALI